MMVCPNCGKSECGGCDGNENSIQVIRYVYDNKNACIIAVKG